MNCKPKQIWLLYHSPEKCLLGENGFSFFMCCYILLVSIFRSICGKIVAEYQPSLKIHIWNPFIKIYLRLSWYIPLWWCSLKICTQMIFWWLLCIVYLLYLENKPVTNTMPRVILFHFLVYIVLKVYVVSFVPFVINEFRSWLTYYSVSYF